MDEAGWEAFAVFEVIKALLFLPAYFFRRIEEKIHYFKLLFAMKKIIGIVLIVLAIVLGYNGVQKFQNSSALVKVLGLKIDADNESGKSSAYIQLGLAVLALGAGVFLLKSER